jgi:hypothetical protein
LQRQTANHILLRMNVLSKKIKFLYYALYCNNPIILMNIQREKRNNFDFKNKRNRETERESEREGKKKM